MALSAYPSFFENTYLFHITSPSSVKAMLFFNVGFPLTSTGIRSVPLFVFIFLLKDKSPPYANSL